MGCYASCAKTLQVWNDLDRHQQKKMKSERMQLHKVDRRGNCLEEQINLDGHSNYNDGSNRGKELLLVAWLQG